MTYEQGDPLPELDPSMILDVDVRDDIANGVPPLPRILRAVSTLAGPQVLHVRSPFRPGRLIERLANDGFHWHAEGFSERDWSSWFWRDDAVSPRAARPAPVVVPVAPEVMDLRLLPPPEPMLRVLERAEIDGGPFDVLVPFFPEPLVRMLEPTGRRVTLIENRPDGVHVRIEPAV